MTINTLIHIFIWGIIFYPTYEIGKQFYLILRDKEYNNVFITLIQLVFLISIVQTFRLLGL